MSPPQNRRECREEILGHLEHSFRNALTDLRNREKDLKMNPGVDDLAPDGFKPVYQAYWDLSDDAKSPAASNLLWGVTTQYRLLEIFWRRAHDDRRSCENLNQDLTKVERITRQIRGILDNAPPLSEHGI